MPVNLPKNYLNTLFSIKQAVIEATKIFFFLAVTHYDVPCLYSLHLSTLLIQESFSPAIILKLRF